MSSYWKSLHRFPLDSTGDHSSHSDRSCRWCSSAFFPRLVLEVWDIPAATAASRHQADASHVQTSTGTRDHIPITMFFKVKMFVRLGHEILRLKTRRYKAAPLHSGFSSDRKEPHRQIVPRNCASKTKTAGKSRSNEVKEMLNKGTKEEQDHQQAHEIDLIF